MKGSVVWRSDVPVESNWFVVVEQLPANFSTAKWQKDNARRPKHPILPKGLDRFCVVEQRHLFNHNDRQVGPYHQDKKEAIENAKRLNGDMLMYYSLRGVFL